MGEIELIDREELWKLPHEHHESLISGRVLDGYEQLVHDLGGNAKALIASAKLPPTLDQAKARISYARYALLLEITAASLDCPDFGIRLANLQNGVALTGPIERLLATAPTVAQVLDDAIKHMHVYTTGLQLSLHKEAKDGPCYLRFEIVAQGVPYHRQAIEQAVTLACNGHINRTGGAMRAREVWFSHRALAPGRIYEAHFHSEVRFSQPFNAIFYESDDLKQPILKSSTEQHDIEERLVSRSFPQKSTFSAAVRKAIHRRIANDRCTRALICHDIGLHSRTLHRRLREEGATFEQLLDETRQDIILHCLVQSDIPLTEVAMSTGYCDLPSMSRACHRWFGMSPMRLRRTLLSHASTHGYHYQRSERPR